MDRKILIDVEEEFDSIFRRCQSETMTSAERAYALYKAVQHVTDAGIDGAFVECGVWRGGSVMVMAETLTARGCTDRDIFLYDTFDGMTEPTPVDINIRGHDACGLLEQTSKGEGNNVWAYAGLETVQNNLRRTPYPWDRFHFVRGPVETTLQEVVPPKIALLRLDTDWYESTRIELEILYPRLQPGGVIIIDDYGHWQGARKAVDEYFSRIEKKVLLNRIDYTGRIAVKT